jgi:hypothetical protein
VIDSTDVVAAPVEFHARAVFGAKPKPFRPMGFARGFALVSERRGVSPRGETSKALDGKVEVKWVAAPRTGCCVH